MIWNSLLLGNIFQNPNLVLGIGFCFNRNAKHMSLDLGPHVGCWYEEPQAHHCGCGRVLKELLEAGEQIDRIA